MYLVGGDNVPPLVEKGLTDLSACDRPEIVYRAVTSFSFNNPLNNLIASITDTKTMTVRASSGKMDGSTSLKTVKSTKTRPSLL